MIEVKNLSYKYKNGEIIFDNINLKFKEGEIVSIIGKNGSGKSTFARLISGIVKPTRRKNSNRWNRFTKQRKIC